MNQILLGASLPFLVGAIIYAFRRFRATFGMLILVPLVMLLSAVWAIVPDIPRALGMQDLYIRMAQDPRCDIFFWHYTIDLRESDSRWYAVGFIVMVALVMFAAWRELRFREREARRNG
jgi:hypothetical protein